MTGVGEGAGGTLGDLAGPGQRAVRAGTAEQLRDRELGGLGAADQVFDGHDLGDTRSRGGSGALDDHVDALADQRVQCGQRQAARRVRQLTDEPEPGQRLPGRAGVNRRVARDTRRQRQQQGQRLPVTDLPDDGHVRCHTEEARDQAAQVDGGPVAPGRAGLHVGHVRQRDVALEDLLGDDRAQGRVELGRRARQQRRLAGTGTPGEDDRQPRPHARPQERRHLRRQHLALDQLVQRRERDAREAPDVDQHVAAAGHVAVDDVDPGAVVELGVLQALCRVQLAVGGGLSLQIHRSDAGSARVEAVPGEAEVCCGSSRACWLPV